MLVPESAKRYFPSGGDPRGSIFKCDITRRFAGVPIGRTEAIRAERLQYAQGFFDTAAHIDVTHHLVRDQAGWIDDKRSAECNAFRFVEHAVRLAQPLVFIAEQWIFQTAELRRPRPVTLDRIHADSENRRAFVGERFR